MDQGNVGAGGGMQNNTIVGNGAGGFLQTGSYNVMMGFTAGSSLSSGSNNTFIGRTAGNGFLSSSSNNVCIGVNAGDNAAGTRSNQLIINNANAVDPLISGDFSTKAVHFGGSLRLKERATPIGTPAATYGELWVKDDAPNALIFTDDAGTDHDLTATAVATRYEEAFDDSDLAASILTVTHSLGTRFNHVTIYDNNDIAIQPDSVTATSTTVATIDLTSFGTLTGTWNLVVS